MNANVLLVVSSYHHNNTGKIADVVAKVLDAQIKTPQQVSVEELREYRLIGFGSGIDSGKHYQALLDLADKLPHVTNRKALIFSTSDRRIDFQVTMPCMRTSAAMWRGALVAGPEGGIGARSPRFFGAR